MSDLLSAFRSGNARALAQAISACESGRGASLIHHLYPLTGRALTIGLTGPPGVGKSTLCSAIVAAGAARGQDGRRRFPSTRARRSRTARSSATASGSTEHFTDPDVFIRSMAAAGISAALAGATGDAVALMDAFGKDVVMSRRSASASPRSRSRRSPTRRSSRSSPAAVIPSRCSRPESWKWRTCSWSTRADHPMALQLQREIRCMMEMLDFAGWIPELVATQALEGTGSRNCGRRSKRTTVSARERRDRRQTAHGVRAPGAAARARDARTPRRGGDRRVAGVARPVRRGGTRRRRIRRRRRARGARQCTRAR